MNQEKKLPNEIRIGFRSKPKDIIAQSEKLLKEEKAKEIHLSAVGNCIGDLVVAVEIMKSLFPQLYQTSIFSTISPKTSEKDKKADSNPKRLFPKLEIILSTEKFPEKKEGSKPTINEEDRKILINTLDKQKDALKKIRKFRNSLRKKRRWGFNGNIRRQRFGFSARRTSYSNRRNGFNRRPFRKSPVGGRKNNVRKVNGSRKNSGNKQGTAKN